jgi:hypothetical protein
MQTTVKKRIFCGHYLATAIVYKPITWQRMLYGWLPRGLYLATDLRATICTNIHIRTFALLVNVEWGTFCYTLVVRIFMTYDLTNFDEPASSV